MKMTERGTPTRNSWTLYPETSAERLLLDRLWEALQSRNSAEWKDVSVGTVGSDVYCSIMALAPVDGREGSSTRSTSQEASPSSTLAPTKKVIPNTKPLTLKRSLPQSAGEWYLTW